MCSNVESLSIITPVKKPKEVAKNIVRNKRNKKSIILDLSVGDLNSPSSLQEFARKNRDEWENIRWIDGQGYAPKVGDSSRQTYLDWLSEIADRPLLGESSIKERFTYREEVSLWWFTPASEKNYEAHPYRWMFYMLGVVDQVLTEPGSFSEGYVWTDSTAVGRALGEKLSQFGVDAEIRYVNGRGDDQGSEGVENDEYLPKEHRLLNALRGMKMLLSRVVRLIRSAKFFWTTLRAQRSETSLSLREDRPFVLLHTDVPGAWRSRKDHDRVGTDVQYVDHYFGDAPWRLKRRGIQLAWLPSVNYYNYEEWKKVAGGQTLDDVLPWMSVSPSKAVRLLVYQSKWLLLFLWYFVIKKCHRKYRHGSVHMGDVIFREYKELCAEGKGMMNMLEMERYRAACDRLSPDAILYQHEQLRKGRTVSAGAGEKTRRIGVQHGILNREHTVYQYKPNDLPQNGENSRDYVHDCPVPGQFSGFGDFVVEQFRQWGGYDAERVKPIGGIRHDSLQEKFFNGAVGAPETFCTKVNLPEDRPTVVICPGRAREAGLFFEMVVEGLNEAALDAFIAVKLHQFCGGEDYVHKIATRRDITKYSTFQENVYQLVACADALVTGTSTLAVESHLLRTPAISVVAHPNYELYPFTEEGIAHPVSNPDEMARALSQSLEEQSDRTYGSVDTQQRKILKRHLHSEDASSCKRLANWLSKISRKNST